MKADGIEYDERMELLETVTYPQAAGGAARAAPSASTAQGHPWVADHELSPKSVVRDMYERAMTFTEYVGFYGLARSEGLVLRYLADAYKALRQTVPEDAKTEELTDLIEWLGELVRQVDSSLIDEWEQLRNPDADAAVEAERDDRPARGHPQRPGLPGPGPQRAVPPGRAGRAAATTRSWASSTRDDGWDADAWGDAIEPYFDEHDELGTGPDARGPALLHPGPEPGPRARRLEGAADLRRPGRRPRLGHQRRGRPGRLRRGRHRRAPHHQRGPAIKHF